MSPRLPIFIFIGAIVLAAALASSSASAQNDATHPLEAATVTSPDHLFQIRYPKSLRVCQRRDGENPDVWSPQEDCTAGIPICDSSGHSGEVITCLAYPKTLFRGSELQAAALAVSRIDDFETAELCMKKWARSGTSDVHGEVIGGLSFQAARATETAGSYVAEQNIYRIFHNGACYELDVNMTTALDSAFAAEDTPRKLTATERERIKKGLRLALDGFRFLK